MHTTKFGLKSHLTLGRTLVALSVPAVSWSDAALAQQLSNCAPGSVCSYVAVQPIDVCSSTGTGCAPFNTLAKVGNPTAAIPTTPIGFVDTATGKDLTRAILNQIGVDLAWSPIQQYKNTSYQTLHVITCPNSGTITLPSGATNPCKPGTLTSADFLQLSQQYSPNGIYTGVVPSPSNPLGVPVSPQPTVVNMFFVNTLVPQTPGALYGFSWINNNGIAISANTFFPPFPLTPRFDTLAHELSHNQGVDHTDVFNYGGTAPNSDLMTAGVSRIEPKSTSDALTQLGTGNGAGSADQLTTDKTNSPSPVTSNSQQDAIGLSGFLNPIALSTTTASTPSIGDITTALVVSNTGGDLTTITAAPGSSKPNTSINFSVEGPTGGRPGETLVGLILSLGKGLHFDPSNSAKFFGNAYVQSLSYGHGNIGDATCPIPATQCLLVQLSGLPQGENLFFTQGIVGAPGQVGSSGKTVGVSDIANIGATITYLFSDGLIITSALAPNCCGDLVADSQHPSTTVPAQIDPSRFVSINGALPCTPDDSGACVPPNQTNIGDGDPNQERQPTPLNPG